MVMHPPSAAASNSTGVGPASPPAFFGGNVECQLMLANVGAYAQTVFGLNRNVAHKVLDFGVGVIFNLIIDYPMWWRAKIQDFL
jgi:hypothetical protein